MQSCGQGLSWSGPEAKGHQDLAHRPTFVTVKPGSASRAAAAAVALHLDASRPGLPGCRKTPSDPLRCPPRIVAPWAETGRAVRPLASAPREPAYRHSL